MLTAAEDENIWLKAAQLGARGVVLKATAPRVIEDCLRAVYRGETWLTVGGIDLSARLAQRNAAEAELETSLTPRELEVVRLVAVGAENQEISDRLAISVGTVKIHLHHVYDKLRLSGRQALLQLLREKKMLSRRAALARDHQLKILVPASRSAAETQPRTRPRAPGPAAAAPPRGLHADRSCAARHGR